jgi:hypothetical protein
MHQKLIININSKRLRLRSKIGRLSKLAVKLREGTLNILFIIYYSGFRIYKLRIYNLSWQSGIENIITENGNYFYRLLNQAYLTNLISHYIPIYF